ncbi:MAG TPA: hypothetical protein VFJ14_08360 [Nocardioidaceae bacterium]|nr:hypothetical protein [Nocardioidaceae bacterium]
MRDQKQHFDVVPILSRGKHRSPRRGACFMEMASYLAGERWSDHPGCTHPLLAEMARLVNDHTSDAARHRLVDLIPSVIGLTSDDPRWDAEIALRAATAALPVASVERQQALAVGVLTSERMVAELAGQPPGSLRESSRTALAAAPLAHTWARQFARSSRVSRRGFRRHAAPTIVRCAVQGLATACVDDADTRMEQLLRSTIAFCAASRAAAHVAPATPASDPPVSRAGRRG